MRWFIYTRGKIPLHRLAIFLLGIKKYGRRINGVPFRNAFYFVTGDKLWWGWNTKELANLGQKIIERCRTPRDQEQHFQKLKKYIQTANRVAERTRGLNLTSLDHQQLLKEYRILRDQIMLAQTLLIADIDAVDAMFEGFLQSQLNKELRGQNVEAIKELYRVISVPIYESFVTREEKGKIRLALSQRVSIADIKKLHAKFWWTKLGWENMRPHTVKDFQRAVTQWRRRRKQARAQLQTMRQNLKLARRKRNELAKKYNLSPVLKHWLIVMDRYTYFHDLRKEMQMRAIYALHLVLLEIARRFKLPNTDLEWLWPDEIESLLRGDRLDQREIKRRQQAIGVRVFPSGIKTWSGAAAIKQYQKELLVKTQGVKEIKGLGVSNGCVKARVKVCSGYQEALQKVKRGDILVCGMTLPDYVPAMKKAVALITDEGGITCHAAVISRELGIPCIVGTKIATQVLQDGDLVEVDADKGVVLLIKAN